MGYNQDSQAISIGKAGSIVTIPGELRATGGLRLGSTAIQIPGSITLTPAVGGATDACDITVTIKDVNGVTIAAVQSFEFWISESAAGAGLTADSASGALTATVGTILTALTAKKHVIAVTASTGIATLRIVDSANPTDQYFCAKNPATGLVYVSVASGVFWEGV